MTIKRLLWLCVLALGVSPAPGFALSTDTMIEGAKQCTRPLPRYERQFGIPVHLLSAISSTESGRWHDGLKISLPWPWTINAEGKGYYFDTKAEAIAAAQRLRAQGVKSMDVGCMQINLLHHPDAFSNLDEAFDPEHNVAYGASFLRSLYEAQKSWRSAAAAYHSKTPVHGTRYVGQVYDRWYRIIDRVRSARLSMASAIGGVASGGGLTAAENAAVQEASKGKNAAPVQYAASQPYGAKSVATAPAPVKLANTTRVINVKAMPTTARAKREAGVLLVHADPPVRPPAAFSPPQQTASLKLASAAPAPAAPTPQRVLNVSAQTQTPAASPRFIFND